ncbi:MAG: pentapeptide repeat-containing protein [Hyphomonas sp.]
MAEAKTKEQLEAEWWKRWRAEDFTWEGLAGKPLEGWLVYNEVLRQATSGQIYGKNEIQLPMITKGRDASLQDYWRADPRTGRLRTEAELELEQELVRSPEQPTYHRVHLPFLYEDGTSTEKMSWPDSALDALSTARLTVSTETLWIGPIYNRVIESVDGRAQFQGGVWFRAPTDLRGRVLRTLSVRYDFGYFLRDANFNKATFLGDTDFQCACFPEAANFGQVTFSGDARFDQVVFKEEVRFFHSIISGDAQFSGAAFSKDALFVAVTFMKDAHFQEAIFNGRGFFSGSTFSGEASFARAVFSGLNFRGSVFQKAASFQAASWPLVAYNWHSAFSDTVFREMATFYNAGFKAFAAFDSAVFERGIKLDESSESEAQKTFNAELRGAVQAAEKDAHDYRRNLQVAQAGINTKARLTISSEKEVLAQNRTQRDARLRELERGCRVLKQEMEKASNKAREQLFYRFELKARRAQKSLRFGEKFISYIYSWTSDYGASICRPVIWLVGLMLVFTLIYWGEATSLKIDPSAPIAWGALAEALSVSVSRVFPFGAYEWVTRDWIAARQEHAGPGLVVVLRLLATMQTALALILLFLLGLTIRRRFQIS